MNETELNQIAAMLEQASSRVGEFKKKTYEDSFQRYYETNTHIWCMLAGIWQNDVFEEENAEQVAECLAARAQTMLDGVKIRSKRGALQLDVSLYMVAYFLPAIVAFQRRCGGREAEMMKLTQTICGRWEEQLGQHIQTSSYEDIQAGFKQKLCFVTTAVCLGLNKSQDCREIALMKRYRDEYLSGSEDGKAAIRAYYDIAPTIVKRIAREVSSEEKYLYLWQNYISKCVAYVESGENESCRQLYETMMSELKEEYMVTDGHRYKS